ncbi:potassium transporter TrkH [Skermanella stibiiresistens SB22]|uniref:Trk system potassium uptake protein n=1 Tax=Skermanella stibiiresistens SB22 TaxID=1385369 RepID=W9H8T1_9PROT|nr:TrkH family potassium uptake protein [Skermanella stibiiresistens]EWY40213.1 potassium transporter TrkH [Skermanella stibiiresistens SB22]
MAALDVRPVFYVIGSLLTILAVAMLAPMLTDLAVGSADWRVFGTASALTLFFGVLMLLTNWSPRLTLNLRQTFLLTTLSWVIVCLFSALPFMFSEIGLSLTDAYFEAMSGLTTTGSTVIAGLDTLPPGLLLWRALTQWLGGIGIVAMGIAILPFLRVGGMQLFRSESSDRSDKVVARASDLAIWLGWVYLTLTIMTTAGLRLSGMTMFDAITHAMAAVSTGGFSTRDPSITAWGNDAVEWVLVVAMIAGGLPFVRFLSFAKGDPRPLWRDTQVRWYLGFLAVVSVAMGLWLAVRQDIGWYDGIRLATFNVVSVVTTTGFASADYNDWGPLALAAFLVLTLVGGCTGSTAGGIKIFRFEILFLVLKKQLVRLYSPNRVYPVTYNEKMVDNDIMLSVMSFGFVFMAFLLVFTIALGAAGLDLLTALSGSATALANVGPGLGPIIGPVGNFATLPDVAKWILTTGMLLGRLEFFTVLVLMNPNFWRG